MSAAARAFTVQEFNKKFIEIQKINPTCAAYLVDIGIYSIIYYPSVLIRCQMCITYSIYSTALENWTRAHFKGQRYNIMDSNIAESWNNVIKEAREYPLITMFEYIRTTVMSWLALRRAKQIERQVH